jgi:hypothetical protein
MVAGTLSPRAVERKRVGRVGPCASSRGIASIRKRRAQPMPTGSARPATGSQPVRNVFATASQPPRNRSRPVIPIGSTGCRSRRNGRNGFRRLRRWGCSRCPRSGRGAMNRNIIRFGADRQSRHAAREGCRVSRSRLNGTDRPAPAPLTPARSPPEGGVGSSVDVGCHSLQVGERRRSLSAPSPRPRNGGEGQGEGGAGAERTVKAGAEAVACWCYKLSPFYPDRSRVWLSIRTSDRRDGTSTDAAIVGGGALV